jgi:hypothetical protein
VKVLYFDQVVIVNNYEGQSTSAINLITGTVSTLSLGAYPTGIAVVQ